jgi:hypothetical protein
VLYVPASRDPARHLRQVAGSLIHPLLRAVQLGTSRRRRRYTRVNFVWRKLRPGQLETNRWLAGGGGTDASRSVAASAQAGEDMEAAPGKTVA